MLHKTSTQSLSFPLIRDTGEHTGEALWQRMRLQRQKNSCYFQAQFLQGEDL